MATRDRDFQLPIFNWVQKGASTRFDPFNPLCILLLCTIGVFFIYSAQVYSETPQYPKQIAWIIVGAIAYIAVSYIDYGIFLRHSHWIWALGVFGLILVLTPLGEERGGSQRWIVFRGQSVQPSEPAKLSMLIMCASILVRGKVGTVKDSIWTLVKLALAAGIPMVLIMRQPDLGSTLVIPPMVFSLLYVSNLSKRFFTATLLAFVLLVSVIAVDTYFYNKFLTEYDVSPAAAARDDLFAQRSWLPYLHDYQRNRILSFVAPDRVDPQGISYNLRQSLITVGSGGLTGKGWAQGTQARLGYLPKGVAHNDFIFSVLAEETGFLGSVTVLGLFGLVLANGVRIAGMARDRFGTLLALGVTAIFAVHVFINIGMTIGLVPITGLPLPFLSYGGTFLLSCCVLQGLVQSVYRYRKEFGP